MLLALLIGTGVAVALAQDETPIMIIHEDLIHPRRGHSNTVIGDVMWVTSGRAYYSHYLEWGQDGIEEFVDFPNIEWINLNTGEKGYTNVGTGKDFYKATAFRTSDESPYSIHCSKKQVAQV